MLSYSKPSFRSLWINFHKISGRCSSNDSRSFSDVLTFNNSGVSLCRSGLSFIAPSHLQGSRKPCGEESTVANTLFHRCVFDKWEQMTKIRGVRFFGVFFFRWLDHFHQKSCWSPSSLPVVDHLTFRTKDRVLNWDWVKGRDSTHVSVAIRNEGVKVSVLCQG